MHPVDVLITNTLFILAYTLVAVNNLRSDENGNPGFLRLIYKADRALSEAARAKPRKSSSEISAKAGRFSSGTATVKFRKTYRCYAALDRRNLLELL